MAHPHPVRLIAQQSGLSEATVDRVLNRRGGVRPGTVAQVHRAVSELDRQAAQVGLTGRTFVVDLVMQAPARFSSEVRAALEAALPALRPAVFRARFHLAEGTDPAAMAATLAEVGRRRSHGVLLKAPDDPAVAAAVDDLVASGVPVVTLFTDVPLSARAAYVGIDNRAAGATAAYLLHQWAPDGSVLVTVSSSSFLGEDQRELGFRSTLRSLAPGRRVVEVEGTHGLDEAMLGAVTRALEADPSIRAVYSVGGGNVAAVEAFERLGRPRPAFVAHDLDHDNLLLLRRRRVSVVLHHDLRGDLRRACHLVMQAHRAVPGVPRSVPSSVQVVTPYNEPGSA